MKRGPTPHTLSEDPHIGKAHIHAKGLPASYPLGSHRAGHDRRISVDLNPSVGDLVGLDAEFAFVEQVFL